MLAGHETSAKAVRILSPASPSLNLASRALQLTFGLWELAKHRDCQGRLRAEISETLARVKARGDADFAASDFESMPYLVAVTKVRQNHSFVPLDEGKAH